jgi:DNA transformation protein
VDTAALAAFVLEQLRPLPVRARAMFGGRGLYLEGKFFGIVTEGRLYLRTDEESRADYLARGMQPLQPRHRPRGPRTVDRNVEVPSEVLTDADLLREWALRAART